MWGYDEHLVLKIAVNAIPPLSHCLVINKVDGRLVTKLHQKQLHIRYMYNEWPIRIEVSINWRYPH